ncbi:hypothetical protein BOX15_Mlig014697g2, partial [Macrostomum lignano]
SSRRTAAVASAGWTSGTNNISSSNSNGNNSNLIDVAAGAAELPSSTSSASTVASTPPTSDNRMQQQQQAPSGGAGHSSISIKTPTLEAADAKKKEPEVLIVMGFNLAGKSPEFLFTTGCLGVFIFYCLYGYVIELIFRTEGVRPHGTFITAVQFGFYVLLACAEQRGGLSIEKVRTIPWRTYALLGFLTVTTMGASNTALGYLSYPTQVIMKCCKLVPTMIGGILIQGRRYNVYDVSAMFCMIFGLIWFTLADSKIQPNFDLFGVFLMSLALCADGAIGNVQERTMKAYNHTASEMILYTFLIGFGYLIPGLLVTNKLFAGLAYGNQHVWRIYGCTFIMSITGYVGMQFVLLLVQSYGALPAVTVTTCRKAVTIVLSFFFFSKPFTMQYVWSGLVVVLGIYLNLYSKNKTRWDAAMLDYYQRLLHRVKGRRVFSLQSYRKESIV